MEHYVGLDISMKETSICIIDQEGKVVCQRREKSDPESIAKCLKNTKLPLKLVGIESGSLCHWLVAELKKQGIPAVCIDARHMAIFLASQINKTDDNDARGIAEAMRCKLYREVTVKSQETLELSTVLGVRRTLVSQRVQTLNTIRGLLKSFGIRLGPCGEKGFSAQVKKALEGKLVFAKQGIEALLNMYETLLKEIDTLNKLLKELVKTDEKVKSLMTIPGIGVITALNFKVELGDPNRFKNSYSVGAYFGMTPREYSSGERRRLGSISKCGSREVRSLLTEAGIVILTRCKGWSRLKAWGLKIQKRHGTKKAAIAVGRKLAVIMHQMLVKNSEFIYGKEKKVA